MRHFKQIASADEDCRIDFDGHFLVVVDQLAQENRVMDFDALSGKRIFWVRPPRGVGAGTETLPDLRHFRGGSEEVECA